MLATVLLALVLGGELRPTPEPVPIVGGDPVLDDAWRSTVIVDLGVDLCTGTLISERVVLTAAHCLMSSPPAEVLRIELGNTRADPELVLSVDHYALDPDFCANIFECDHDLHDFAYLYLAEPAPADAVVPKLPTDQRTYDATTYRGAPVTLVGFGYDESLEQGIKRAVDVDIRGFTESGLELFAGGDGKDGCQGDSGGPVYAELASGEIVLVAVSSRGLACGEGGYFGVTPPALCWIGEELGIAWDPAADVCSIDTDPSRSEHDGCSIAGPGEGSGTAVGLLVVVVWLRRGGMRRSSASRRDRPETPRAAA